MEENQKIYFVTYAFEKNNGSSGLGRAVIGLKHDIRNMDDILEIEEGILSTQYNENIKLIKVNVINYIRM